MQGSRKCKGLATAVAEFANVRRVSQNLRTIASRPCTVPCAIPPISLPPSLSLSRLSSPERSQSALGQINFTARGSWEGRKKEGRTERRKEGKKEWMEGEGGNRRGEGDRSFRLFGCIGSRPCAALITTETLRLPRKQKDLGSRRDTLA